MAAPMLRVADAAAWQDAPALGAQYPVVEAGTAATGDLPARVGQRRTKMVTQRVAWDSGAPGAASRGAAAGADLARSWEGTYEGKGDLFRYGRWSRGNPAVLRLRRTERGALSVEVVAQDDSLTGWGLRLLRPVEVPSAQRLVGQVEHRGARIRYELHRTDGTINGTVIIMKEPIARPVEGNTVYRLLELVRTPERGPGRPELHRPSPDP